MANDSSIDGISDRRRRVDRVVSGPIDAVVTGLSRRWLALWNGTLVLLVGGAFAAPALDAAGQEGPADAIYGFYRYLCHQLPYRTSFVFGHKLCLCDRCVAIYAGLLVGGLAYVLVRGRLKSASLIWFGLTALPMAIDGFTQLFGWRESDLSLRLATGLMFGLGAAWLAYPMMDKGWRAVRQQQALALADTVDRAP